MPRYPNHLRTYFDKVQEYWFHAPQRRFAREAGIAESTLSRIMREQCVPNYIHICRIIAVLERKLGRKIDPREVFEPSRPS